MLKTEKKVEYIELIYDLIFVYLVGCNNELLLDIEDGFFSSQMFITYLFSALAIQQIWFLSTVFINRYGSNSASDFLGLFINMYLLYYMAEGPGDGWNENYLRYNMAWGLILVNLAVQYLIHMRKGKDNTQFEKSHTMIRTALLLGQACIIFLSIPLYYLTGFPLSWVSLFVGFICAFITRKNEALIPVNFMHLTERVMLYVVLTFGEMIVSLAVYFKSQFNLTTLYFSVMSFLIVVGLFLSYGLLYDRIIDRNMYGTGDIYMLLHIVLLIALCNITVSLQYMPNLSIDAVGKNVLITGSIMAFYLFVFMIAHYAREGKRPRKKLILQMTAASAVYAILTAVFYKNGYVSIALSVLYVFCLYRMLTWVYRHGKKKSCDLDTGV